MNYTRLIVKPVQRSSYQGRHMQRFSFIGKDGQKVETAEMGKVKATTKDGRSCAEVLVFKPNVHTRKFEAGMNQAITNPFKGGNVEELISNYNLSQSWRTIIENIVGQELITKQLYLEIVDSVDPGEYHENMPTKKLPNSSFTDPKAEGNLSVISGFKLRLFDGANIFDSKSSRGRLSMQLIKMRPDIVAKDFQSINPSEHRWYIAEENEEMLEKKKVNDMENEAIVMLYSLKKKHPTNILRQMGVVLTDREDLSIIRGQMDEAGVDTTLNSYIKDKGPDQFTNISKFLKTGELMDSNMELFHIKYLVKLGFINNVFRYSNGSVFWLSQQNNPDKYKYDSIDALETFFFTELQDYTPGTVIKNYYGELLEEFKNKSVEL